MSFESSAVVEAEQMAETHLARTAEVEKVGNLVRWLENLVRVPGTKFGVGLDALLGFVLPGVGDAVAPVGWQPSTSFHTQWCAEHKCGLGSVGHGRA